MNLKIRYNTCLFKLPSCIVRHWSLIWGGQGNTKGSGHTYTAVLKLHLNYQINIRSSSFPDTVVHLGHFPAARRGNLSPSTRSVPQFPWKLSCLSFQKEPRHKDWNEDMMPLAEMSEEIWTIRCKSAFNSLYTQPKKPKVLTSTFPWMAFL